MDLINIISNIPLFEGLSSDQYEALAKIIMDRVVSKGKSIFSEGEVGKGFYIVISGKVKIFKLSFEGKEQILHIAEPNEPFGEVSVFAGQRFPAHAETLAKSRLFFFPRSDFMELIKKNPSIAMNMLAILSQRLHKLTVMIDNLSLKEVPGKTGDLPFILKQTKTQCSYT